MILNSGTRGGARWSPLSTGSGTLAVSHMLRTSTGNRHVMNRIAFRNPGIAWPDRYNTFTTPRQAQRWPLQVGNVTISIQGTGTLAGSISALGDMASTIAGLASTTFNADQGAQISCTMAGTSTVSFPLDGIGNLALTINIGFQPSAEEIASNLLDAELVEVGLNVRNALRLIAAAVAGKLSGAPGATITIRNAVADSKDRITASVDANGNRTSITYDQSN